MVTSAMALSVYTATRAPRPLPSVIHPPASLRPDISHKTTLRRHNRDRLPGVALPRCGVAAPRLPRASRPTHRAGGVGGAAGADDHLPRLARSLRPPSAPRARDAAHLALRLGKRRSGVRPPLRRPVAEKERPAEKGASAASDRWSSCGAQWW